MAEFLLTSLNEEQRQAVEHVNGSLLVIAGAGSGKTRVITSRLLYLIENGVAAENILALTFTNKAGEEMRERVLKTRPQLQASKLQIFTFHSFGLQIMRRYASKLGYSSNFSVYDTHDQLSCLRATATELSLDLDYTQLQEAAAIIGEIKTQRCTWQQDNLHWQNFYQSYVEHMQAYNALDFNDLIVLPQKLFCEHAHILRRYCEQYRYIMVDEFQDTSLCQYRLLKLLAGEHGNLCCVGDDDQSIYSWRGANYRNIAIFEKDFPERREIKLVRNYRSTATILQAANAVIKNNNERKEKELQAQKKSQNEAIYCHYPENETAEAQQICSSILQLRSQKQLHFNDFGVLVRTNSLMRSLEAAFLEQRIPYQISGGLSFFQRSEIKDICSYLRLMVNYDDNVNFLRVINTPRRGIGPASITKLRTFSNQRRQSLYRSARQLAFNSEEQEKTLQADLSDLVILIEEFSPLFHPPQGSATPQLAKILEKFVEELGYWNHLLQSHKNRPQTAQKRYDNIKLFIHMLDTWQTKKADYEKTLRSWLNRISLITRDDHRLQQESSVQLLTIHAAKGLEFEIVYLPGLEEGVLPHARSSEAGLSEIEEERRLFYVALTRARQQLHLSSCIQRYHQGKVQDCSPSSFIQEIPEQLLNKEAQEDDSHGMVEQMMAQMPWKR